MLLNKILSVVIKAKNYIHYILHVSSWMVKNSSNLSFVHFTSNTFFFQYLVG